MWPSYASWLSSMDTVVHRLGSFGYYDLTTATHRYHATPDQRRTCMGAGTLRRNGNPDYRTTEYALKTVTRLRHVL